MKHIKPTYEWEKAGTPNFDEILNSVREGLPAVGRFFSLHHEEARLEEEGKKIEAEVREAVRNAGVSRRRFLKILGTGAALATLFPRDVLARPEEKAVEKLPAQKEAADVLGPKLKAIFERSAFDPRLDIYNDDGTYLIYFPQRHKSTDAAENSKYRSTIVAWQRSIEQCLLDAQKEDSSFKTIFAEGVDSQCAVNFTMLRVLKYSVDQLECKAGVWSQLLRIIKCFANDPQEDVREMGRYIVAPKFIEFKKKFPTSVPSGKKGSEDDALDYARLTQILFPHGEEKYDHDDVYMLGASIKMAIDGTATVLGAETAAGSDNAFAAFRERLGSIDRAKNQLRKELNGARGNSEKVDEIIRAFNQKVREISETSDRLIFEEREKIALECIDARRAAGEGRFLPIVFGAAHDFSNNVRDFNAERREKLGLIELTFR